ncbi:MAG: PilZ domain-containing protein [Leptospira sp.]|nr:PilZ domain-containing protein [Leptospira sp.]
MNESRTKTRLISGAWEDFVVKVYSKNEAPEFFIAAVESITEIGMSGIIEAGASLQENDTLSGLIVSDQMGSTIKYEGRVLWTKETSKGIQFGLKFSKELLLPDVLIALAMAAA